MDKDRCYHRFSVPGARLKGAEFDAPVVNLSKTGIAILTERELKPGDSYGAWLETETSKSWIEGRVVWCAPRLTPGGAETAVFEVGLSVQVIDNERPVGVGTEANADGQARARGIRSAPRVEVSGMRLRAAGLDAAVANLSSRGLAIRLDRELDTGQAYDARLETLDGTVQLTAIVVWCKQNEALEEGLPGSYAAGLSLSDVDQHLSPLAEELLPVSGDVAEDEIQALHWPGPEETSGVGGLSNVPAPSDTDGDLEVGTSPGGTSESAGTVEPERIESEEPEPSESEAAESEPEALAPWLAELTEESAVDDASPERRSPARWLPVGAAVAAVVGVAAILGFNASRSSEEAGAPVEPSPSAASRPVPEPAALQPAMADPALDEEEGGGELDSAPEAAEPVLGAIVPRAGVNVRGGPGLEYPVVRRTGENERLLFVARQSEWFRLQADEELWMHEMTVLSLEEEAASPSG